MAEVKWIKLSSNIFENRKIRMIESMPDGSSIVLAWLKLLCLAGSINDSGMVYFTKEIPYTDQMLSTQFNMPLTTVQIALKTFHQFGMTEMLDNMLHISNWEKYQNIEGMEKIREQNRIRNIEYRSRKKQSLLTETATSSVPSENDISVMSCVMSHDAIDKEEDKNKKKNKNKSKNIYIYSDLPELNQAIVSFIEFRKSIRKPMTERAVELMMEKLNTLAEDPMEQVAIINQSIMNGWLGVFPLKEPVSRNAPSYQKPSKTAAELDTAYSMMTTWAEEGGA